MRTLQIQWRGTWGMGDAMMAMNVAHLHAWKRGVKVNLEMHWEHGPDHLHHFEEEETLMERMEYIHNFYHQSDRVEITHKYNQRGIFYYGSSSDSNKKQVVEKNRFLFQDHWYHNTQGGIPPNEWIFNLDHTDQKHLVNTSLITEDSVRQKIVIWRPLHNSEPPRTWKRLLTNDGWNVIIAKLRRRGFNIVELTYRTPIREVLFHIRSCRLVLSYDGMWHYIAKNLGVPYGVVSTEEISAYHTPPEYVLNLSPMRRTKGSVWEYIEDLAKLLGDSKASALKYQRDTSKYFEFSSLQAEADSWQIDKKGPTTI
jgi:hypothetical protein